ncbi:MAG: xanthine dehydrogenase small subunit [Devosia sp.]
MTDHANAIRFILNDTEIALDTLPATQTLLDFLRLERRLRGTKEGCAEGDCGACTVLVGRLTEAGLVYEPVNACIRFTGSLNATHVVTIEHLSAPKGPLHPVQQAMVDHHGSQCGFCTPGFVMALYALWMGNPQPSRAEVEKALQGNLCRCTGYAPIIRAAQAVAAEPGADPLVAHRQEMADRLAGLRNADRIEVGSGKDRVIVPASVDDLALAYADNPGATIVAGATDVGLWVTKFMRDIGPLIFVSHLPELHRVSDADGVVRLGAAVSYREAEAALVAPIPALSGLWNRIGGEQVRAMGTVGGNIANGSPIGDTPPPLIALGATVTLRRGGERRTLALEDFFIAYGKQDRQQGEFVESIAVPHLPEGEHLACYKISKRREEDISSLLGAFRVKIEAGTVTSARIAFGGMAATPKRAKAVEAALVGQPWSEATVLAALPAFAEDFQPITDMRASSAYRLLVAQNLLRRFFAETQGRAERLVREVA